ncbi:MAG: Xaa-Pro dipeptidase [Moorella sp. (in: firmicutes)]|uniref:M24 family metallopeptidase n=1 Tax=Moorella sp. E306M TaxID=2572683 RepID=UPI0010FFB9D7|nr:Xaa-Pro peptidase family protein [Moorella sp. E306M]MDK2817615.1 Xaa-Pro dipeptidase [Moorella sp. (in: firmicutes)]MDK2895530.1 Xaa-Pro dipeptidase [Moorella sp. (in: firmicutes)]GEA18956.1 proline dipeptidase [Moorella sp. E306M]
MGARFVDRFEKARRLMAEKNLDLLLVVNRENLIYFTGLTQIECLAVLIPREGEPCAVTLWLDAGYVERESGLTTYGYYFPRETLASKVVERIRAYGLKEPRIGFERYFVDFALYDGLRQAFPEKNFIGVADLFYRIRSVKEAQEIEFMRQAAAAACRGMEAAIKSVRPGVTELDILAEAEYAMLKAGSGGSSFRPQVVSGERALLTHPCASNKKIAPGEAVVIHLGATYEGYCAKMCRTVAVGRIPPEQENIYYLLLEAQDRAIAALRPGATAGEVDAAAREVVETAGYGNNYLDLVGYGVGLRQSEFYPIIGKGRTEVIEAGMVVDLLLPTIYRPGIGGPRVTDVIYVGENKNEILTDYPRELVQI